ncbi:hypothetical protein ACFVMC_06600 [Nocardia sp. NPDC127579]|uniref:hypothetical protein n=1 Tax=Nocardia sp. NPDC127579 TaxID=3345402 RepID=UPI00362AF96B
MRHQRFVPTIGPARHRGCAHREAAHWTRSAPALTTVAAALAGFATCVASMNLTGLAVLAAATLLVAWLARGRRCRCGDSAEESQAPR